jgi:hypothetical protein
MPRDLAAHDAGEMYNDWMSPPAPCHLTVFALIHSWGLPYRDEK